MSDGGVVGVFVGVRVSVGVSVGVVVGSSVAVCVAVGVGVVMKLYATRKNARLGLAARKWYMYEGVSRDLSKIPCGSLPWSGSQGATWRKGLWAPRPVPAFRSRGRPNPAPSASGSAPRQWMFFPPLPRRAASKSTMMSLPPGRNGPGREP